MKETKIYIMMVGSTPKVWQSASQALNFNFAYCHLRYIYTEKLIMASSLKPKLVNWEMYPNASYKFSNITGAKYCKKYGAIFTEGMQRLVFCYSIMLLKTGLLPCNY